MGKATVKAGSDVALVKYWGKKDEVLRLPENGSISMKLAGLETVTTVEFSSSLTDDEVVIGGEIEEGEESRVIKHLDRIRDLAGIKVKAKVVSENNFPKGTGLSSSGSGFAALTLAGVKAAGLDLTEKELSILARQGSGTACRCVCGGFVEWKDGETSETSYSETIFPQDWWDIRDVVAVVNEGKKQVSSTEGHKAAQSSRFFKVRQEMVNAKLKEVAQALRTKDFTKLGETIEAEALEFHSILLTSTPAMIAWYPGTIEVMKEVLTMRSEGLEAYFTINTGFNVHVLALPENAVRVKQRLEQLPLVQKTLEAGVGGAPVELGQHLF